MKREAEKSDASTKAGMKKKKTLPAIEKNIKELEKELSVLTEKLNDWFDKIDMDEHHRKMITAYYIKGDSKVKVERIFHTENFYQKVRYYCFKL